MLHHVLLGVRSEHSFGDAKHINAGQHPLHTHKVRTQTKKVGQIRASHELGAREITPGLLLRVHAKGSH